MSQSALYYVVTVKIRYREICARWIAEEKEANMDWLNGLVAKYYEEGVLRSCSARTCALIIMVTA
jgi:hypothetical protein